MNRVVLTITFDPASCQVQVNGPISDKMLCHGLLGMAADALRDHWRSKASRIIQPDLRVELPGGERPS